MAHDSWGNRYDLVKHEFAMSLIPKKETKVVAEQEAVQGVVVNANERGFQLQGEESWRNWSKWATEPRTLPSPGHRIQCLLDKDGYVRSVALVGGTREMAKAAVKERLSGYVEASGNPDTIAAATDRVTYGPATNRSAEREFRVKVLDLARQLCWDITATHLSEAQVIAQAERIIAWAEGRAS